MEARLQKWGNSMGIRIPSQMLKKIGLKENDEIELTLEDNKIMITKAKNGKISLKERFDHYHGENLAKNFSWDESRGNEIW